MVGGPDHARHVVEYRRVPGPVCTSGSRHARTVGREERLVIEVFVESIRVNTTNHKRVVMLKEKSASRFLPIWIGSFEADAIAIPMQNVPVARPLTHDLLGSVVASLGAKVIEVVINRLADETFYAQLVLDASGKRVEVDARPSDAIAVAIRAKVPIFVDDSVLDQAGMVFDNESDEANAAANAESEVDETKLSVFKDFIETLDIGDLDKGGSGAKEPG